MKRKLVVMMHGTTAAGKSTTALQLCDAFQRMEVPTVLLKTSQLKAQQGWRGLMREDTRRDDAYRLLHGEIELALHTHDVVITTPEGVADIRFDLWYKPTPETKALT